MWEPLATLYIVSFSPHQLYLKTKQNKFGTAHRSLPRKLTFLLSNNYCSSSFLIVRGFLNIFVFITQKKLDWTSLEEYINKQIVEK